MTLTLEPTTSSAICPRCQHPSHQRHSWYWRAPADLPISGRVVRLKVHVRRFFCRTVDCPQRIFSERLGDALPRSARRTTRHAQALTQIAFALGGRPAARLACTLGFPTSRRTLLRLLRAQPLPARVIPRVLGIDDWAWKKGRQYCTILVDLERHQVVDLLPDRESATVAAWLQAHPGVEIVSRDRAKAYGDAVRTAVPTAVQVLDRWHILKNLTETIQQVLGRKLSVLAGAAEEGNRTASANPAVSPIPHGAGITQTQRDTARQQALLAANRTRYQHIHTLAAKKIDGANIARQLGLSRTTVYKYRHMTEPPRLIQQTPHIQARVQAYKPYLVQRWNEGCGNAKQMWREIVAQGYPYGPMSVERFVRTLRVASGHGKSFRSVTPHEHFSTTVTKRKPLTPRQASFLFTARPEKLLRWQTRYLQNLTQTDTDLAHVYCQAQAFADMVRQRTGANLERWFADVATTGVREVHAFATELAKEREAVQNGLTLIWSNGPVEGFNQRLKTEKRAMYGRGSLALLKARLLHLHVDPPPKWHRRKTKGAKHP